MFVNERAENSSWIGLQLFNEFLVIFIHFFRLYWRGLSGKVNVWRLCLLLFLSLWDPVVISCSSVYGDSSTSCCVLPSVPIVARSLLNHVPFYPSLAQQYCPLGEFIFHSSASSIDDSLVIASYLKLSYPICIYNCCAISLSPFACWW